MSELVRNSTSQSVSSRERSSEMGRGGRGLEPRSQGAMPGKRDGGVLMGVSGGVEAQTPFTASFFNPHATRPSSCCPQPSLGGMMRGGRRDLAEGPCSGKWLPFIGADLEARPGRNPRGYPRSTTLALSCPCSCRLLPGRSWPNPQPLERRAHPGKHLLCKDRE